MRAVTAAQMRAIDAAAVARESDDVLMRRAGEAIARVAERYVRSGAVIGLAGAGNNGGDAFAALAELSGERIVYHDPSVDGSAARVLARERAQRSGVEFRSYAVRAEHLREAGLVLDGLLGVNARLPLDAATGEIIGALAASGARTLALDIATGTDPTTGACGDVAVRAIATVALGRPKLGSLLDPGRAATGELWCAPIGMHDDDAAGIGPDTFVLTATEFAAILPRRSEESEKRRSGAPLIFAGSEQFPGAATLCARGAARAGAGYVTVCAPVAAAASIRAHLIEQVVVTIDESSPDLAIQTILDAAGKTGAIGLGPGLGLSADVGTIVRGVIERSALPIVADASALFHLAKHVGALRGRRIVLTPHAGEFARLSGRGTIASGERFTRLRAFVDEYGVTTLLKGQMTLIADTHATHVNTTGTSALATAGTGDVLTGMIATLLSQGLEPIDAARVGAYWHGLAGRVAAQARPVGVIAGDVAEALGMASVSARDGDPIRLF